MKFYDTLGLPSEMAAGAVSETQAADSLPDALLVPRNKARLRAGTFESFLPRRLLPEGGMSDDID